MMSEIVTVQLSRILGVGEGKITSARPDGAALVTDSRQGAGSTELESDLSGAEESRIVTIRV